MRGGPVALVILCGVCACSASKKSPKPKTHDAAKSPAPATDAAVARPVTADAGPVIVMGVQLSPGCVVFDSGGKVGAEGSSTTIYWVACPSSPAQIAQAFGRDDQAREWELPDEPITVTLFLADDASRPATAPPPPGSNTLIRVRRQNAPPPCPPCEPGSRVPPGCSCP